MRTLLVANRGEIAVRIIRAARQLGLRTVAVVSEADAEGLPARLADTYVILGPSPASESYLRQDRILDAARETGADAIHPGYGFLAENADFAQACHDAGIVFVGPSPDAMRSLGGKISAKRIATQAGVAVVPGMFEPGATRDDLEAAATQIGFPVLLKASAGGGGRGMRIVNEPAEFREQYELASKEAESAFGDGAMMVEKLVRRPRHIEVQVLADRHGTVAALFERECSVQRRHQKLVEEAPSPLLCGDNASRYWSTLRDAAIRLAQATGYVGAGTVEFVYDPEADEFYFLEVNARLQVEHPVTELVTGIDLVEWQLRIARGERLDLSPPLLAGDRSALRGWAIECRLVAESPDQGFAPSIGPILGWATPNTVGVRVDSGYEKGSEVSRFYDSLLAKVIAHGENRDMAIRRARLALADFHVLGVRHNGPFLADLLDSAAFRNGKVDTDWLTREFLPAWSAEDKLPPEIGSLLSQAEVAGPAPSSGPVMTLSTVWGRSDTFRNVAAH